MDLANRICKRLGELRAERSKYESHWTECFKYGAPERQHCFSGDFDTDANNQKQRADLLDSTAADAVTQFVSNIISGTTPANAIWFNALPDGVDDPSVLTEGEQWLDFVCQFIWRNIHGANYDSVSSDLITDFICAGWAVLYNDVDRQKGGGYSFQNWPINECFLATTRSDGRVDTIYREYTKTAAQLVSEFGEHKVSEAVKSASAVNPDMRFKIIHVIEPRNITQHIDGRILAPKQMPFASYHVEVSSKTILKESGYNEFPCAVPLDRRIPGSIYAVGQMSIALADAKTANSLMRDTLRSAEIDVLGMWLVADDGIINPNTVKIGGGKIIAANSIDESMKRLDSGNGFQVAIALLQNLQSSIQRKLMADQLPPYGQPMTAAETYMRIDIVRQKIGPMYGRLQAGLLIPLLDRCFALAYRAGVLGEAPEELQGRNMSFKFISPLARAQQLEDVAAIERFMGSLAPIAELEPSAMDNVDIDAIPQVLGQRLGVPTSILRTQESLEAYRNKKAEAQQQAQAQEQQAVMAQQLGGAVSKGIENQLTSEVMQ